MQSLPHILLQGDHEWGKLIIPLVVFVMWALSALQKKVNEASQKEKLRQVRQHIQEAQRQQPVPQPVPSRTTAAGRRFAGVPNARPVTVAARVPQPARREQPSRAKIPSPRARPVNYNQLIQPVRAPARPPPMAPSAPRTAIAAAPAPQPAAPAATHPPSVNAAALHRWLRPVTLRRQFILTEVLQPPITLREHHLPA